MTYLSSLNEQQQQTLLHFWFEPWQYTHQSWLEKTFFADFQQYPATLQRLAFIPWCKSMGIEALVKPINLSWLQAHIFIFNDALGGCHTTDAFKAQSKTPSIALKKPIHKSKHVDVAKPGLNIQHFKQAIEMLGSMVQNSAKLKHHLNAHALRWCYQHSLGRPIILMDAALVQEHCKSSFELGLNILFQIIMCHAQFAWKRILLIFEQGLIKSCTLWPQAALSAPMLLIALKTWQKIVLFIQQQPAT